MKKGLNKLKIGLLGGGQLGRMLLQKAADYSLSFHVLDPDPDSPCRFLCEHFEEGSFLDFDTVYRFGKGCDLVTIEIENVNADALEKLESEGVLVFPQSSVIRLVQDKGEQKMFFLNNNIPTAPFKLISNRKSLIGNSDFLPVMQKVRRGGYDGKGVKRLSDPSDFDGAFDEPSVIEKLVNFKKEISVIVARNASGECVSYPAVEMEFNREANLVEFLSSPAALDPEMERKAEALAIKTASSLNIVGLLAVEMFLTDDGIFVNEIAPRPHNSGHHTIEANLTSQYDQHLRAILNLPLGKTETIFPSVMINLLGEKNHTGAASYTSINEVLSIDGVHIHLYGKKTTKPFRKMGHVIVTSDTLSDAHQKAQRVKSLLRVISEEN